ncbi:MmpS family transport accessory protein [Pedobacter nototheniae]|uniref:MmpS family transport accessory protein n=1 Tax=Pedobacter nototheniae TaxID=2488994 RepID=UPI002930EB3B|nr:MmpS family transport accessory protein [Pedobacter nototheniae]
MKNLVAVLLLITVLSSCSLSIHYLKKGKIDVPQKETYAVTYQALFGENTSAKISYLDENGKRQKLKGIRGQWEKTIMMKPGSNGHIKATAKGNKARGEFKVLVDGKVISEQILTNKKVIFGLDFYLP